MREEEQQFDGLYRSVGDVEISLATDRNVLDPYEPLENQLKLQFSKAGNARKITFNEILFQIDELIEFLEEIKDHEVVHRMTTHLCPYCDKEFKEEEQLKEHFKECEEEKNALDQIESGLKPEAE